MLVPRVARSPTAPAFELTEPRSCGASPGGLIACSHGEEVAIPGGSVKLYLDDSGLNRDSANLGLPRRKLTKFWTASARLCNENYRPSRSRTAFAFPFMWVCPTLLENF